MKNFQNLKQKIIIIRQFRNNNFVMTFDDPTKAMT